MKEEPPSISNRAKGDIESKGRRPYQTPKMESYGSISTVTQHLDEGNYLQADTLLYTY